MATHIAVWLQLESSHSSVASTRGSSLLYAGGTDVLLACFAMTCVTYTHDTWLMMATAFELQQYVLPLQRSTGVCITASYLLRASCSSTKRDAISSVRCYAPDCHAMQKALFRPMLGIGIDASEFVVAV